MDLLTPEQWQRIDQLLDQALDLPPTERTRFLVDASKQEAELRTLLLRMWASGKEAEILMDSKIPAAIIESLHQIPLEEIIEPTLTEGTQLGDYTIVREVGQGGMSVVYEAERTDGQFVQRVALKTLKRGMDSESLLRRFLTERQILAELQHPNIAHLIDGGATPDGRPYFVMEYIKGTPITEFCDTLRLPIQKRLDLLKQVASAVEYAHRNLVVHRDLKPSNILVTDDFTVKLLDFGIAKILAPEYHGTKLHRTIAEQRILTPGYAAPEQILGHQITTATDVYALGVLMYELVCGTLPHAIEKPVMAEIQEIIRTESPLPPSRQRYDQVVTDNRSSSSSRLQKALKGDLDTMVLKALKKEPERRYASAREFSQDIGRFQKGFPVTARPDTFTYRAKKFYNRNRAGVIGGAIAVAALILGLTGTIWQARIVAQERDVAQQEAKTADRVTNFLVNMFEYANPEVTQGDTLSVFDVLQEASSQVDSFMQDEPEVLESMTLAIGRMYMSLGSNDKAEAWFQKALQRTHEASKAASSNAFLEASLHYGALLIGSGQREKAERIVQPVLEQDHDLSNPETRELLSRMLDLRGRIYFALGQVSQAESLYHKAVEVLSASDETNKIYLAIFYEHLGRVSTVNANFKRADQYFQKALAVYEQHPEGSILGSNNLQQSIAGNKNAQGDYRASENYFRAALEETIRLYGANHHRVFTIKRSLGTLMIRMGNYAEAITLLQECLNFYIDEYGPENQSTLTLKGDIATTNLGAGRLREAQRLYAEVIPGIEREFGEGSINANTLRSNLGVTLLYLGQSEEAEQIFRASLNVDRKLFGHDHPTTAVRLYWLAHALLAQERWDESLNNGLKALSIRKQTLPSTHHGIGQSLTLLGRVFLKTGDYDAAKQHLLEALQLYEEASLGSHHYSTSARLALSEIYSASSDWTKAIELAKMALQIRENSFEPSHWLIGEAKLALGKYLGASGAQPAGWQFVFESHTILRDALGEQHMLTMESRALLKDLERQLDALNVASR